MMVWVFVRTVVMLVFMFYWLVMGDDDRFVVKLDAVVFFVVGYCVLYEFGIVVVRAALRCRFWFV